MNDSEVKRDLERLKRDCEGAERFANHEWREGILELLRYVEDASLEKRKSEEFHRSIWKSNPIASMKQGELSYKVLDQVVGSEELRSWVAGKSVESLPNNPERRSQHLEDIHNELIKRVCTDPIGLEWRPRAAVTRLLAALFPRDFTSLIASRLLSEFISYFNKEYPTLGIDPEVSAPEKHRQILKKLDDALGTVPEGNLEERVRRMTLPHQLYELWSQEPRPKPQPADDASEETTPQNIILYGPPGTGKTYATFRRCVEICDGKENAEDISDEEVRRRYRELIAEKRVGFVTFHQSYGYEEFVEGLRPVLDEDEGGDVRYELHDGIFKRIALRAADDQGRQYVLIIDEINRGNVSKILGELITLLEPDKRLGADNELKLPLSYSPSHRFGVPPNLHILGTMNTADRSIALMDVALRRRFTFEERMPDETVIRRVLESKLPNNKPLINIVVGLFNTLNERIRFLYDRDHQLGHSYFLEVNSLEGLRRVFVDRVIPLLQEYFYGDWHKICAVLGCPCREDGKKQDNDKPIVKASQLKEMDTLGFDHDEYEDQVDFGITPDLQNGEMSKEDLARTFLRVLRIDGETLERRVKELTGSGTPSDIASAEQDKMENGP